MDLIAERLKPKTYEMLYELAKEPMFCYDLSKAKIALNSVLHTLASQLDLDHGITVLSNLPPHLKTHFSNGWNPFADSSKTEKDFISILKYKEVTFLNSLCPEQIKSIIKSVFSILMKYIPTEKMERIASCFTKDLKNILEK